MSSSGLPSLDQNISPPSFDLKSWRERFIISILRIACLLGIVLIVVTFPNAPTGDRFLFIGLYLALLGITILPLSYHVRAYALLLMIFTVGANAILGWGPWADGNIFLLASVILSSLLLDRRVDAYILGVSILFVAITAVFQQLGLYQFTGVNVPQASSANWAVYIIDFSTVGTVIILAVTQFKDAYLRRSANFQEAFISLVDEKIELERSLQTRNEELENQSMQLHASVTAAKEIGKIQDIADLFLMTAQLISEKFGYYHVGLFILDEQKNTAFLQASSSETGKRLIGQSFHVESDRKSPLRLVVEQSRPVLTSDEQLNFMRDENFPLTRSRMVLPLSIRGNTVGMLDMHSDQPQAFSLRDADVLQILADLTAIAFDNVRLTNETKSLLSQLETNTSIQTQRTWSKLTSRNKPVYQYTPAGVRPVFAPEKVDDSDSLKIPLLLHGQSIGNVKLKRKGSLEKWTERERTLIEKITEQIALALENSRLVDEAQKSATRDQMIANFSTRVRETLDIDSVIRTAATEIRRVFDLKEAEISIGVSPTASPQKDPGPSHAE